VLCSFCSNSAIATCGGWRDGVGLEDLPLFPIHGRAGRHEAGSALRATGLRGAFAGASRRKGHLHGALAGMGESSLSLEIIKSAELFAMCKSLGAADAALEQIAKGDWSKKEYIALARRTIELMKRFEAEAKRQ
jgi:hypothetical protein